MVLNEVQWNQNVLFGTFTRGWAKKDTHTEKTAWGEQVISAVNTMSPLIRTLAEVKIKWFDLREMAAKKEIKK